MTKLWYSGCAYGVIPYFFHMFTLAMSKSWVGLLIVALLSATSIAEAGFNLSGQLSSQAQDTRSKGFEFSQNGFAENFLRLDASKRVAKRRWGVQVEYGFNNKGVGSRSRVRRNNVYLAGRFGRVSIGLANDVADGFIDRDLAGTAVVTALSSNSAVSGVGVDGFDPENSQALRFYSPAILGLAKFAAQLGEDESIQLGLKVSTQNMRFNAFVDSRGLNMLEAQNAASIDEPYARRRSGVLLAYKMAAFTITAVASKASQVSVLGEQFKPKHSGLKLGYTYGKHRFSASHVARNDDAEATGLQYLYRYDRQLQLYMGQNSLGSGGEKALFSGLVMKF